MYLEDITVPIPFEQGKIIIRNEKTVQMELEREYSSATQNSRVRRRTIGKVVPLFQTGCIRTKTTLRWCPTPFREKSATHF